MNVLGRFLYALPFMILSILYFRKAETVTEALPLWEGGVVWVYICAIIYAFASTSILVLKQTRLACMLLGVVLSLTVLMVHLPNFTGDQLETMSALLKDMGLAGAAFYFAATLKPDRLRLPGFKGRRKL